MRVGLAVLVVLLAFTSGCNDEEPDDGNAPAADPTPASWLVTLTGENADLRIQNDGTGEIVLHVPANVVAFTDRPERQMTSLSLDWIPTIWDESFGDDPPNAEIMGFVTEGEGDAAYSVGQAATVTILSAPAFDADENTLTFAVELVGSADGDLSNVIWQDSSVIIDAWYDCIGMAAACVGLAAVVGIEVLMMVDSFGAFIAEVGEFLKGDEVIFEGCAYEVCACFDADPQDDVCAWAGWEG